MALGAQWPLVLLPGAVLVAVVVLCWMLPHVSPPGVLFGVTVGRTVAEGPGGAEAVRLYRMVLLSGVLVPVLLWGFGLSRGSLGLLFLAALAVAPEIIAAYLVGHFRARALHPDGVAALREPPGARTEDAASSVPQGPAGPGSGLRTLLGAVPYALVLLSTFWLLRVYPDLPDPFPVHTGPSGEPDRWAPKSPAVVFLVPAAGLVLLLFLELIRRLLRSARLARTGSYAGFSARSVDDVLLVAQLFIGLVLSTVALGMAGVVPGSLLLAVAVGAPLVLLVFLVGFVARLAKERHRWPVVGDGLPDTAWKLGLFYVNPGDPALMVPRRFGIGWTLNFARPAAWGLLVLLLGVPLLLALGALAVAR
jgi:Family of unknown function (DUF5808)/Protein of unknown function (DUF1648)